MNKRIYNYSIHLLARQDYSEFKMKNKLLSKKDNSLEEVLEVISELKRKNYLREDLYKRGFIKKWLLKGESTFKIQKRGDSEHLCITPEDIELLQTDLNLSSQKSVYGLMEKKLRSVPKPVKDKKKLRDKILRFLISKGYTYDDFLSNMEDFKEYFE